MPSKKKLSSSKPTMQDHLEGVTVLMDPMNNITNGKVEVGEKFQIEGETINDESTPENPSPDGSYGVLIEEDNEDTPTEEDTPIEEHTHIYTTDSSGNTVACCQQDPNTPMQTTQLIDESNRIKTPRSEIRNKF